ncbi:HdeD family acid-resistance protein [Crossiella sp. NPDC003009]
MGDLLLRRWWLVVVRGVAAILFGVLSLLWPGLTLLVLVVLFAVYALLDGIAAIAGAAADKLAPSADRWLVGLLGAFGVLAGLVALLMPGITALVLLFLIGAWAVVTGVLEIMTGWQLRKVITGEWLLFVSGALSVVLGGLLFAFPGEGAVALVVTIAMFAILWGIVLVLLGIRLRKLGRDLASTQPR